MRIVIDTNVLVAALRSRKGASFQIISILPERLYQPMLSVPLVLEYEDVLKREIHGLDTRDIDAILNMVAKYSKHVKIYYLWRPFFQDAKDDMLLELALAGQAEAIITFNVKDFKQVKSKFGIDIIQPRYFWQTIKNKRKNESVFFRITKLSKKRRFKSSAERRCIVKSVVRNCNC